MKKLGYLFLMLLLIMSVTSCNTETDVKKLLENPKTRKSIFNEIITNNAMHKEIMTEMMANKEAMNMMHGDTAIMHGMMDHCMEACKSDTSMMDSMCKKMMDDPAMNERMEKMKHGKMGMSKMKDDKHAGIYSCPMHPAVHGKYNAKCTKCGMLLTKPVKS